MGNVVVNTGTIVSSTPTAYGNQRKIDRTQNGVLWCIILPADSGQVPLGPSLSYSTDNGTTWTAAGTAWPNQNFTATPSFRASASLFIDIDDYAHIAYRDHQNGFIYYLRGVPNATRTAYSWSAVTNLWTTNSTTEAPDIVAHRDQAVAGAWVAHVVWSEFPNTSICQSVYKKVSISAAGAVTTSAANSRDLVLWSGANQNHTFPSIDFNHIGDGKTVKGGQPDLYTAGSTGQGGSGYGIRFRKATYSNGSWAFGNQVEIDPGFFINGTNQTWLSCIFDGTRVMIGGALVTGSGTTYNRFWERDAADTTTTLRWQMDETSANQMFYGSLSYDSLGNLYAFGQGQGGARSRRWVRSTQTIDAPVIFDATPANGVYVSARRGPQGQAIDYVWTDGTSSPYSVSSGRIGLNQAPTATTPVSPADNASWNSEVSNNLVFQHNDPDGDAASSYRVRYRPAGTTAAYQFLTGTTTAANGTNVTVPIAAGVWVGVLEYASQTYDPSNTEGAWSATRTITSLPATLTGATGGQGGTSLHAQTFYNTTETDRAKRALALV